MNVVTQDANGQHRVKSSQELRYAKLKLAIIQIGECLSDLGTVLAQGGVSEHNNAKVGGIAVGLERCAANVRGEPHGSFDMLKDIAAFHAKFEQLYDGDPRLIFNEMAAFRIKFMREEITEFEDALNAGDLEKAFDALIDLDYVQKGTVHLMGVAAAYAEGWRRVHGKNMQKELARDADHSKESTGRGYALDVVKPVGWTPPRHWDLLGLSKPEDA